MKKIIIALVFLLPGCALLDSYNMAKFDNNEYYLINRIRTSALLGKEECGSPIVKKYVNVIWIKSNEFNSYSESIPNNEETVVMSTALLEITKGLYDKYKKEVTVNKVYCKSKFDLIYKNATTIQNVVGGKPR